MTAQPVGHRASSHHEDLGAKGRAIVHLSFKRWAQTGAERVLEGLIMLAPVLLHDYLSQCVISLCGCTRIRTEMQQHPYSFALLTMNIHSQAWMYVPGMFY